MPDATRALPAGSASATTAHEPYPSWRALAWFSLYRVLLATGLILAFIPSPSALWRATAPVPLTAAVAAAYPALVLLGVLATAMRWPPKGPQVQIAVFVDILAFTLLMHGAGGVGSGIGLLVAIAVAAGALLMEGRLSLLFASLATLGVLTQQFSAQLQLRAGVDSLTHAGLLGITFFTVALLAHILYRRIREAEQLAARHQVDIADLSQLNEFIIQRMGTGVLVVDRDRRLRLLNAAAAHLLGMTVPAMGQRLEQVAPALAARLAATGSGRAAGSAAGNVLVQEREIKPSFRPLGESTDAGVLIFLRDNRELVQEAQQIKLASLGRLTASIAHNIRNPLSAVKHAGQLLAESAALGAEERHLLDIVRRNAGRIDEIVESVLQLSRREQAAPQPIDLAAWLAEFCNDYRETRNLPAERLQLAAEAPVIPANADPRHLHQVFSNLCDNALKHAGEMVRIQVRAYRAGGQGAAVVEVADDGPGIPPQIASEIFTPFFSASTDGTGLGLYISRALCETNGIELEYIPADKRGSFFRLTFAA